MIEQELREKLELDLIYWREIDRNREYADIKGRLRRILAFIKEAGCVQLAEDQSLPTPDMYEACYGALNCVNGIITADLVSKSAKETAQKILKKALAKAEGK